MVREPRTRIGTDIARRRYDHFSSIKKKRIENISPYMKNPPLFIRYAGRTFLDLLEEVMKREYNATGLRVYFACYCNSRTGNARERQEADEERIPKDSNNKLLVGHLTLVYALTSYGHQGDPVDDSGKYFIFDATGKKLIEIGFDVASEWVADYRKPGGIQRHLHSNAIPHLTDTNCVWFSLESIKETHKDITDNHSSRMDELKITAFFSAYPPLSSGGAYWQEFDYGPRERMRRINATNLLTVTFGTGTTPDSTDPNIPSYRKFFRWLRHSRVVSAIWRYEDPQDYDTAAPCPPAEGCGSNNQLP